MIVSDLIKRAYGITSAQSFARDVDASRANHALVILQGIILNLPGMSQWVEQDVSTDVQAEENDRLRVVTTEPITITLASTTTYRERLVDRCGCVTILQACMTTRAPKDGARVWIVDSYGTIEPRLYIYVADQGTWRRADNLTLTDEVPISADFQRYLIPMLAVELGPEGPGSEVPETVYRRAKEGEGRMRARYGKRADAIAPLPRLSTTYHNDEVSR